MVLGILSGILSCGICGLAACSGGMDMVFSGTESYDVNAYINGYSLSECSILRRNDRIRPYFVNSVAHDPDIRGLVVSLQYPSGQTAGKKIRYTLTAGFTNPEASLEKPVIPEPVPANPEPKTSPAVPPAPEVPAEAEVPGELPAEQEEIPGVIESPVMAEPAVPGEPAVVPKPSVPAKQGKPEALPDPPLLIEPEIPEATGEAAETPVIIEANLIPPMLDEPEMPEAFPSYPAIPEPEVPVESPVLYVPERSENRNYAYSPEKTDQVISVARLDQDLPVYQITESLEIGQYTLVFQVLGEKTVLAAVERPVYFLGDAVLTFDDMQRYLPGFSKTAHFVPPGATVLIEAQVISDTRLDPYVVWYNGKKRIGQGKLEDTRYLFWKAPERTGFYTIKAVLFPFKPPENTLLYGTSKELSLPVSAKSARPGYFSERSDQFTHWYQFENNLLDAKDPQDPERRLYAKNQQQPRWLPHESIYGLSIGPEDIYLLQRSPFLLADDEQGSGQILFRGLLFTEGTLFKMVFIRDSSEPLTIDLAFNGETLILRVSAGALSYEEGLLLPAEADGSPLVPSPVLQTGEFVTVSMTFTIQEKQLTARVSLEDRDMQSNPCTITLDAPLSGEGTLQFGSESPLPGMVPEAKKPPPGVAIFDEVGISFTTIPLPRIAAPPPEALPEML
ncbi:MAG: hypothetical protein LBU25_08435 [Treponema sp.]|nr:hypothetical protein [Treponema sp.]